MERATNVEELRTITDQDFKDLNALMLQLSSRGYQMEKDHANSVVRNEHNHIFVIRDDSRIIAMATLMVPLQMAGRKGYLEDLVVDQNYRRRGLGQQLVRHAISAAQKMHVDSIELKSELNRVAANELYQKLHFARQEANVYKIKLP